MAKRKIFPVFIPHLGCPNDCVFCDQKSITGSISPSPVSGRDVGRMLSEARDQGCCDMELAFYGGSFTAMEPALQEDLLASAQPFVACGTIRSIRLSTRPDAVDAAVIGRLKRYGVETVELGAQSMSDRVLRASGRGHTAQDTVEAARLLADAGFRVILQMMTGLPGSDDSTDIATARSLAGLHPDGVRVYPTVILADTALARMWRGGRYIEHTVADAVRVCAEILPLFENAHIPVIRLGLNPTEELSGGVVIGGAYHPALGELVRSEVLRRRAALLLCRIPRGSHVVLGVAPRMISAMVGQRRRNIFALREEFDLASLSIRPVPDMEEGSITVLSSCPAGERP